MAAQPLDRSPNEQSSSRIFVGLGALNGLLAVGAGAFGAHALKGSLEPEALNVWQTAAHYELVHAVMLVAIWALASRSAESALRWSGWLMFAGMLVFSGSLYALALSQIRTLAAVTPLGGVMMLAGWLCLALWAFRRA